MVKCTNNLIRQENVSKIYVNEQKSLSNKFQINFFFASNLSFSSDNLRPTVQTQAVLRNVRTTRTDQFPICCKLNSKLQASGLMTVCAVTNLV